jgi:hypothetical protein
MRSIAHFSHAVSSGSDNDHKKSDWYGIHEQICQYLIPIRSQLAFLPSHEERKKRDAQIHQKKVSIVTAFHAFQVNNLSSFDRRFVRALVSAIRRSQNDQVLRMYSNRESI